jgi:phospholipid/cholesterol/gamma-HCH transport system substrate-binding protein
MTYKNMSYISGIIIFLAFIIFFGGVLWLSGERILSLKEYRVYFKFPDVVGLRDRSQVFMRGYRIGWTKEAKFEKDGVLIRVDIKREYKIPIDSKIEINTLNLIGEKAITIAPGTSKQMLKPNGILEGTNKDIMIMAKNILTDFKENLDKGEIYKKILEVSQTLGSFHNLFEKLDAKIDKLDMNFYNEQIHEIGQAASDLRGLVNQTRKAVDKFSIQSNTSLQNFDQTLQQFSKLSTELLQISQRLNAGEGTAGELLKNKEYIQNLNSTISELKLLIEDIKKNPKKYISLSVF